jgi:hypothetical protein
MAADEGGLVLLLVGRHYVWFGLVGEDFGGFERV